MQALPDPGLMPLSELPQAGSEAELLGRNSHGIAVQSTNSIPHSTWRSGTGMRLGYRERRSTCGNGGWMRSHSPFGTIQWRRLTLPHGKESRRLSTVDNGSRSFC